MRLQTAERGDTGQPPSIAVDTLLEAPKQTMKNKPSHSRHGAIPKMCCIKITKTRPSPAPQLVWDLSIVSTVYLPLQKELESSVGLEVLEVRHCTPLSAAWPSARRRVESRPFQRACFPRPQQL